MALKYSPQVVEKFRQALEFSGGFEVSDDLLSGHAGDRRQGAEIRFYRRPDAAVINGLGYRVYGCPHLVAACEQLRQDLEGAELIRAEQLEPMEIMASLGIPPEKAGKILLLQDALVACCREAT